MMMELAIVKIVLLFVKRALVLESLSASPAALGMCFCKMDLVSIYAVIINT